MLLLFGFFVFHCLTVTGGESLDTRRDLGIGDSTGVIVCLEHLQRVGIVDIEHVGHGRLVVAPPSLVVAAEDAPVLDGHLQGHLAQMPPLFTTLVQPDAPNGGDNATGGSDQRSKESSCDSIEGHVVLLIGVGYLVGYVVSFVLARWITLKVLDWVDERRPRLPPPEILIVEQGNAR